MPYDVSFGDARGPYIGAAVSRDLQFFNLMPSQVEVPFVQRGVFEVHVIVTRKGVYCRGRFQGNNIFKDLVFLLHHPARSDGILLIGCSLVYYVFIDVRLLKKIVNEVFKNDIVFALSFAQTVQFGLEFMISDSCINIVKGDVNEISCNNVHVSHGLKEQGGYLVKRPVNVCQVNDFHVYSLFPMLLAIHTLDLTSRLFL